MRILLIVAVIAAAAATTAGPEPPNRAAVQLVQAIAEAARTGAPRVRVPAARYVFSDLPLRVVGARNLVIDVAAGAEFAFFLGTGVQFVGTPT